MVAVQSGVLTAIALLYVHIVLKISTQPNYILHIAVLCSFMFHEEAQVLLARPWLQKYMSSTLLDKTVNMF